MDNGKNIAENTTGFK